jgi:hypothetical protein
MKLAFKLFFMTENLTEASWSLWIGMQMDIEKMLSECEDTDAGPSGSISKELQTTLTKPGSNKTNITVSPDRASDLAVKSSGLPIPLSSSAKKLSDVKGTDCVLGSSLDFAHGERIVSYKTLQDFYTLLDKIERTSYVGALFLEAYAEKLRDDMCKDCWVKHNVNLDMFWLELLLLLPPLL